MMDDRKLCQIVKKAAKGNQDAFIQLYNFFIKNVYYLALKITGNEHDANDVVQETMIKLYNNISHVKEPRTIKKYVYTTTHNVSIDIIRKREKVVYVDDEIIENVQDLNEEFLPIEYIENEELRQDLLNKIDSLSVDKRVVLILRYYQQLSIKEIAKILDISEAAVKNRLYRAKIDLEIMFKDKSLRKGGTIIGAALLALTKVFSYDAEANFNETVYKKNLDRFLQKTNMSIDPNKFSFKEASRANNIVNHSASKPFFDTATFAKVALGLTVSLITISTGRYIYISRTSPEYKIQEMPISNSLNGADQIKSQEKEIIPILENESTAKEWTKEEDIISSLKDFTYDNDDGIYAENHSPNDFHNQENINLAVDEESSTAHSLVYYNLRANNYILKYQINSKVTEKDIIRDANLEYSPELKIEIHNFDQIDFNKKNQYGVVLSGSIDGDPKVPNIGIIIFVDDYKNFSLEENENEKY